MRNYNTHPIKPIRVIRQTEFIPCSCGYCDELIPRLTVRGYPAKFKNGHGSRGKPSPLRGRKLPEHVIQKMRLSKLAENNPNWIGDKVGYSGVHGWVKRRLLKPDRCENCNIVNTWLDLACVTGTYTRDLSNWKYLCRTCHMDSDGRLLAATENLRKWRERCYQLA